MEPAPSSSEDVSATREGSGLDSCHGLSSASTIGVSPGGGSQISTGSDAEKPCSLEGSTDPDSLVSDDKSQSGIILPSLSTRNCWTMKPGLESFYKSFLASLVTSASPSLAIVEEFLGRPNESRANPCDECLLCEGFEASVIRVSKGTAAILFRADKHIAGGMSVSIVTLMETIHRHAVEPDADDNRLVLLVGDLKPRGLLILGAYLDMDPRVFERYLSDRREFTNTLPGVATLGYVQGYTIRRSNGSILKEGEFVLEQSFSLNRRRGKLKRFWRDVAGHEQRMVVATTRKPKWLNPIDIVLLPSLPEYDDLSLPHLDCQLWSYGSSLLFPSFAEYLGGPSILSETTKGQDNMQAMQESLQRVTEKQSAGMDTVAISAVADFICTKWQGVLDQVQEAISESNIPDMHDLRLIRSMMNRRQVFSETGRTLSTLHHILSSHSCPDAAAKMETFERRIKDWVADMDSTLSTISSYLALDEAERSIRQGRRGQKLTALAFVFIPASTVAAAFGMNVDVLGGNPSISWFVIAAASTTIVTFAYATWYSQLNTVGKSSAQLLGSSLWHFVLLASSFLLDLLIFIPKLIASLSSAILSIAVGILWLLFALSVWLVFLAYFLTCLYRESDNIAPDWVGSLLDVVSRSRDGVTFFWNGVVAILGWTHPLLDHRRYWRQQRTLPKGKKVKYYTPYIPKPEASADCIVM